MAVNSIPRSFAYWPTAAAAANDFRLDAGSYGLTLSATVWGTATLQKLLPDGVTYVTVAAAIAASGYTYFPGLPAGQYRLVVAGTTAFIGEIAQVAPGRRA